MISILVGLAFSKGVMDIMTENIALNYLRNLSGNIEYPQTDSNFKEQAQGIAVFQYVKNIVMVILLDTIRD
ncbi:MAG: hypothetical protein KKB09_07160 [Nanoarchaeota archaeon]|nr:hypothetical protein [Nanoarchaeota archaeon]